MNWTQQTEEMMKSWAEAQKRIWEGWVDAARKPGQPTAPLWGDWFSQWQEAAKKAAGEWSTASTGAPKALIERLFSGEEAFLRFVELALGAFKTIAPGVDAGEHWVELLRRYLAQMKQDMGRGPSAWMTPEGAAAMTRDVPELWRLYLAEVQKLGMPWVESLRDTRWNLGEVASGDRQAVVKLYNTFMDNYEATFGKFLSAPAIGFSREMNERLLKGFEAWIDYKRASVELQTEMASTGFKALENLLAKLVETSEKGEKVRSFRQLFDLWAGTAESAYFELFSSESFANLQGRLVNSAMRYRIREREIIEEGMGALGLPTRTEIDGIHRHVHDLRDEVIALKRELAALRKARTEPAADPPASPAPRGRKRPNAAAETAAGAPKTPDAG